MSLARVDSTLVKGRRPCSGLPETAVRVLESEQGRQET